jgi:hypothetical protein
MRSRIALFVGSLSFALVAASSLPAVNTAEAACSPGDAINGTTAGDAQRAMQQAGYSQIQIYEKGCDNAWHGHAYLNGNPVNVVWNGAGQVLTEGD